MLNFTPMIGIDLGTTNILVYLKGKGVILREPAVLAVSKDTQEIQAIGDDARLMLGRTPGSIIAIRPMSDGVIADYTHTQQILAELIRRACGFRKLSFLRPRVLICIPSEATNVERRAVKHAALDAGAREVEWIEEPMAAAIGAGLAIDNPIGNMVVDIGGGTTDVAVLSLGGIVTSKSLRVAGDKLDEQVSRYIRSEYNLQTGERTAEEIKIKIGSAYPLESELKMQVRGRDLVSGLPKTIEVTSPEIRSALSEPVSAIVQKVKAVLEETPPELAADIIENGIYLTGGGALLRGLDRLLQIETKVTVRVADDPLSCVAIGTGRALDHFRAIQRSHRSLEN
ncbi:MAG TPA: rod shape-determining protein [Armatimonadota bacterium]|jgi:rod shape-determining protein MreB